MLTKKPSDDTVLGSTWTSAPARRRGTHPHSSSLLVGGRDESEEIQDALTRFGRGAYDCIVDVEETRLLSTCGTPGDLPVTLQEHPSGWSCWHQYQQCAYP